MRMGPFEMKGLKISNCVYFFEICTNRKFKELKEYNHDQKLFSDNL